MSQILKSLSLTPRGVRYKLIVAFALMSLIPIFVFGYVVAYYVVPRIDTFWEVYLIFIVTIVLMFLGFYLARKVIYPIVEITAQAKEIAAGRFTKELAGSEEDEIGQLRGSLNMLSSKLKSNMSELNSYGEKIRQINMEINKKMFALSGLLQIGNLITAAGSLDEILSLIVTKLAQLEHQGGAFLLLFDQSQDQLIIRAQANLNIDPRQQIKVKVGPGALGKVFSEHIPLIIDQQRAQDGLDQQLRRILPKKNIAVLPISSSGKMIGVLAVGNNKTDFVFSEDALELIGVFVQQVAVAVESELLISKTKELSVIDELTGLYNESYIHQRFAEEIKRATSYQRPCSFAVLQINNFEKYRLSLGADAAERRLKRIAQTLKAGLSEIDKAAHLSAGRFGLLLPEKNKQQARKIVENIKKEVEKLDSAQLGASGARELTISAGLSATPIDGTNSEELFNHAISMLTKTK
ncbi:diguanylate cyclase domain-containing protein [Candidatus Omnitrophota bacterium]